MRFLLAPNSYECLETISYTTPTENEDRQAVSFVRATLVKSKTGAKRCIALWNEADSRVLKNGLHYQRRLAAQMRGACAEIIQIFGQDLFGRHEIVCEFVSSLVRGIRRVRQSDPVESVGKNRVH